MYGEKNLSVEDLEGGAHNSTIYTRNLPNIPVAKVSGFCYILLANTEMDFLAPPYLNLLTHGKCYRK